MTSSPAMTFAVLSTRGSARARAAARERIQARTVSTLWLKTSGRSAITFASGISSPRKSGVSTSTLQLGRLLADLADDADEGGGAVVGQVVAVDARDDRVAQAHRATLRATRAGSSGSFHVGLPVLTLQKPQRRCTCRRGS